MTPLKARLEIAIVLGLSLGESAIGSIIRIIDITTRGPVGEATATLNRSQSPRPLFDVIYQLFDIITTLMPVALALFLLHQHLPRVWRAIGCDTKKPLTDLAHGMGLAALIGIPGLGLYFAGRALGITAKVVPAGLDDHWWTVPILILHAAKNGILEEIIVVAYLFDRLPRAGLGPRADAAFSAILRGAYHLYQGYGAFIGNVVMGIAFWWYYAKTKRVMPLIIAHTLLDVVAFVGYSLLSEVITIP